MRCADPAPIRGLSGGNANRPAAGALRVLT